MIKPTTLPRLSVMPAGHCDAYTLQALAQEEVGTVLGHLKDDYDFIIIDVSPVMPVTDAMMIGQHVDAVILSVLKNVSRMPGLSTPPSNGWLRAWIFRYLGAHCHR